MMGRQSSQMSGVNTPEYLHMMRKRKIWAENMISQPIFHVYQQLHGITIPNHT